MPNVLLVQALIMILVQGLELTRPRHHLLL